MIDLRSNTHGCELTRRTYVREQSRICGTRNAFTILIEF